MNHTIHQILRMMVFRAAPQDLPGNKGFTLGAAVVYVITGAATLAAIGEPRMDLAIGTDVAANLLIVWLSLSLAGYVERIPQTLSANFACGSVFNLLAAPILSPAQMGADGELNAEPLVTLAWWVLFLWSLWVNGHIFRHALEMKLAGGIMLATLVFSASTAAYWWSVAA